MEYFVRIASCFAIGFTIGGIADGRIHPFWGGVIIAGAGAMLISTLTHGDDDEPEGGSK